MLIVEEKDGVSQDEVRQGSGVCVQEESSLSEDLSVACTDLLRFFWSETHNSSSKKCAQLTGLGSIMCSFW